MKEHNGYIHEATCERILVGYLHVACVVAVLCGSKRPGVDGPEGEQTTQGVRHPATTPARTTTTQVSHHNNYNHQEQLLYKDD